MTAVAGVAPTSGKQTVVATDQGPATRLTAATTLADMVRRVHEQATAPLVWESARKLVAGVQPRDEVGQAAAIRSWCAAHFKFINDPLWHQLLETPLYALEHIRDTGYVQGNCADAAMLTAALCTAIHIPCRFIAVGFHTPDAPYSHVFTMAYPHTLSGGKAAAEMDITRPPGLTKAGFTRRLMMDV